jgi:uncharacterized membrane protein YqjE
MKKWCLQTLLLIVLTILFIPLGLYSLIENSNWLNKLRTYLTS